MFIIFLKPRMLLRDIRLAKKFIWGFSVTYRKSRMSFLANSILKERHLIIAEFN